MKVRVSVENIAKASSAVLLKCGVPANDVQIVVDSIVDAHRRGKGTHGISRLPIYVRKIRSKQMDPETKITLVRNTPVVSVMDANHGFGQVAAIKAMRLSVEKAFQFGIGVVGVRHSNNFGTAAFIAEEAAKNGQIGVVFSNASPAIAPTGGRKPIMGTNPLGIAFPTGDSGFPISIDMATAVAARGKIRLAAKNGEKIPLGWALDEEGRGTDDPMLALRGSMLPIGEHKGFGLALAIDILAGLLTGAAFGGGVQPLNCLSGFSNNGHFIVAINIAHFTEMEEYLSKIDTLVKSVKNAGDPGQVMLPGERSHLCKTKSRSVVEVSGSVIREVAEMMLALGLSEDSKSLVGSEN